MKVSPIIFWVVSTTIFSDEIHGFQYVSREEREQNFRQGSNVKPHPQPQQQKHRNLRRLHSSHSKSSHHGHHGHNKGPGYDHHKAGPHPPHPHHPHHPPHDPALVDAPPPPPHHPHPFEGPPHPPHHPDLVDAPPFPPHPFGPHHSHSQDHIAHPHHHSLDFEGPPPEGHPPHPPHPKDHFHSKPSHHNGHQHHPKNHHPFMDLFSGRKPGGSHPLMDKLNKGASLIKEEINHVKQEIDHFKESWESAMDELLDNLNMYEADVECASTSDCSAEPDCESFTLPEISDHFVLCASKNDEDFLTGIGLVVRQEGEGVDVEDQTAEQEEALSSASADTQEVVSELIDTEEKEGEDVEETTAQVYCGKPTMEDCSNETDEEGNPCIWCTMNSWIGLCSSPRYEVMISEKMTCPNVGMS